MKADASGADRSNVKTLVGIVATVIVVGLIGGIAGVAFDPAATAEERDVPEVSSPTDPAPVELGGAGTAGSDAAEKPTTSGSKAGKDPASGGDFITINGVQIYVPRGWEVGTSDEDEALIGIDKTAIYTYVTPTQPTTDASAIISQMLEQDLPPSSYSQVETADVVPLEPFGAMVSLAILDYRGLWTDNQASVPVYGRIIVMIRQDGTLLELNVQSLGGLEQFNADQESWSRVVGTTMDAFAGV